MWVQSGVHVDAAALSDQEDAIKPGCSVFSQMILSPSFLVFRKLGQSHRKGRQRQRQELLRLGGQGRGGQAQAQPGHRQGLDRQQQPLQPQCRQAAPDVGAPRRWAGPWAPAAWARCLAPAACAGSRGLRGAPSPSGARGTPETGTAPPGRSERAVTVTWAGWFPGCGRDPGRARKTGVAAINHVLPPSSGTLVFPVVRLATALVHPAATSGESPATEPPGRPFRRHLRD